MHTNHHHHQPSAASRGFALTAPNAATAARIPRRAALPHLWTVLYWWCAHTPGMGTSHAACAVATFQSRTTPRPPLRAVRFPNARHVYTSLPSPPPDVAKPYDRRPASARGSTVPRWKLACTPSTRTTFRRSARANGAIHCRIGPSKSILVNLEWSEVDPEVMSMLGSLSLQVGADAGGQWQGATRYRASRWSEEVQLAYTSDGSGFSPSIEFKLKGTGKPKAIARIAWSMNATAPRSLLRAMAEQNSGRSPVPGRRSYTYASLSAALLSPPHLNSVQPRDGDREL